MVFRPVSIMLLAGISLVAAPLPAADNGGKRTKDPNEVICEKQSVQ